MNILYVIIIIILLIIVIILLNSDIDNKSLQTEKAVQSNNNPISNFIIDYLILLDHMHNLISRHIPNYAGKELQNIKKYYIAITNAIKQQPINYTEIYDYIRLSIESMYNIHKNIIYANNRKLLKAFVCHYTKSLYDLFVHTFSNNISTDNNKILAYYKDKLEYQIYFGYNNNEITQDLSNFISFIKNNIK